MQNPTQEASHNATIIPNKYQEMFPVHPQHREHFPQFDPNVVQTLYAGNANRDLLPLPHNQEVLPQIDESFVHVLNGNDNTSKLMPPPRNEEVLPQIDENIIHVLSHNDTTKNSFMHLHNCKDMPQNAVTENTTCTRMAQKTSLTAGEELPKPTLAFQIATWLAEDSGFVFAVDKQSQLCVYEDDFGYFRAFKSHRDFENFLNNTIPVAFLAATTRNTQFEVERFLRSCRRFSTPLDEPPAGMVNLRNGVFDIHRQVLLPHSKTYCFTFFVDANYVSDRNMNSVSENYFVHLGVTNKGRDDLLAVLGLAISNVRNLQKSAFIYGPGGNGKSIFANLVRHLLPHTQVAGLNFADLANPFAPANLDGKLVSISSDETAKKPNSKALAVFKKIVGQDFFEAQRKNVQHTTIRPNCFLIFISNYRFQIRKSDDPNGGVQRRVWFISTGDRVDSDKVDLHLEEKLLEDRDAVVSEALRIAGLYVQNWQELMPEPTNDELYIEVVSNPTELDGLIASFVEKELIPDTNASVAVKDIFDKFCNLNTDIANISGLKLNGFAARLKKFLSKGCFLKRKNISTLLGYDFSNNHNDFII